MPAHVPPQACLLIIDALSALAPEWRREDWRREWLGEVRFRAQRLAAHGRLTRAARLRLIFRCAGAFFHVLWLWKYEWSLDMLLQDLRYAARMLGRRPAFAVVATLTLALGIGATTAMFGAVHAVLLKPLPYADPDRLVKLSGLDTRNGQRDIRNLSMPDVVDLVRLTTTFDAIGAHNSGGYFTLTGVGEPERVPRLLVTSGYFRALAARPLHGRLFRADEDRPSPPDVVVISHGFWQRRFGGESSVVGRGISLGGEPATVVGVLEPGFVHPDPGIDHPPDVFALLDPDPDMSSRGGRYVRGIARMKAGISVEQASADLDTVAEGLAKQYPDSNTGRTVIAQPLTDAVRGDVRTPLWLLQAATIAILLIVCANLANLLLGAAMGRSGELAIRAALGASRLRITRQLLTESLLLAGGGGALGVVLAWWVTAWLSAAAPDSLLLRQSIHVQPVVLLFAAAVSIGCGLLFGLMPAWSIARASGAASLRESGRQTDAPVRSRLRSALVVAEVAVSVTLLVGATLLVRSFWQLTAVQPGFRATEVLSFALPLPLEGHPEGTQSAFYERIYDRLRTLPGVRAVGAVNIMPLSGGYSCDGVQVVGRIVPQSEQRCAEARSASPDYFRAMGIPILRGRGFTSADSGEAARVVVINETMARQFFPGEDPVGRQMIYNSRRQGDSRTVVGVIGDVHHFGLDSDPAPEFYTPQHQPPSYHGMTIVMQVEGDPSSLVAAASAEVRALEPNAPIHDVRTTEQLLTESVAEARFRTMLLGAFAALALLLAIVGTYGVISMVVNQRAREMGIRLALGASASDIRRLVVVQGVRPVLLGLAIGLAGGLLASRAARSLLFHVAPGDPVTLSAAALIILAAAAIAAWLPARRASRVDPVVVLRV